MNRYSFFLWIFVLTACAFNPSPIETTPTRHIPTATVIPEPTLSPRPTLSALPPTPTLTSFLSSLQIVYTGGSSIYLWQAGNVTISVGEVYTLPCMPDKCNNVLLSDDGQLIAYTSQVMDYELSVINKDGSDQKLLIDFNELPGTAYLYGMGWLPNTHLIWFNTIDQNIYHSYDNSNDLYIVNADTGELKNILPMGEGGDIYPSPDGKYLAIVRPESIEIRRIDGRKIPVRLDFEYMAVPSDAASYPIPVWAEDSSSLVVGILPAEPLAERTIKVNIWNLPVTATGPQLVSQPMVTLDMHMKLSYSSQPLSQQEPRLYPISISPDLAWFIYSRTNSDGAIELHLATLDLASDKIVQLGEPGYEYIVDWLPSSKEFFIIQREKEHWVGKDYFLGNIDGQVETFPLNEDVIYRMDWIDDDSYIYVNRDFDLRIGFRGETESILIEKGFSAPYDTYDFLR